MTHEGVREATKKALDIAKKSGACISFDPNLREPLWNSLEEAKEQVGQVVEGVPNTLSTYQMARSLGVRTPIVDAMYDILYNGKHPSEALQELMVRDLREENVKD